MEPAALSGIDAIRLHLSDTGLWIMNICLAFVMFGVALQLRLSHFVQVLKRPRALVAGVSSQFILLPLLTLLLVWLWNPHPSMALGMILVAACPGGNMSNFFSLMARGNIALSVGLTAFATTGAILLTPLNFTLYAGLHPATADLLRTISVDPLDIVTTVVLLLGIPLATGMWFNQRFPNTTVRIIGPVKRLSLIFFSLFLIGAFAANYKEFLQYIHLVFLLVLVHNAVAFTGGYLTATLARLPEADRRSITIETGIQNSGLGLVLIFNFFDGLGGMAIVAGWWGIWHILSGLAIGTFWSRRPITVHTV